MILLMEINRQLSCMYVLHNTANTLYNHPKYTHTTTTILSHSSDDLTALVDSSTLAQNSILRTGRFIFKTQSSVEVDSFSNSVADQVS